MTVKVFLWDEDEWITQGEKRLLKTANGFYEKIAGVLIEYSILSKDNAVSLISVSKASECRRVLLAVSQLTQEKIGLLKDIQARFPFVTILVKGRGPAERDEAMKKWVYVPVLERELVEAVLMLIKEEKNLGDFEELGGRTVLLGKVPQESHAAEIMGSLFKNWQYIEQCHSVSLKLFSQKELDYHILCELEDAAYQYLTEKSHFQAVSIEAEMRAPDIYYVLEAF